MAFTDCWGKHSKKAGLTEADKEAIYARANDLERFDGKPKAEALKQAASELLQPKIDKLGNQLAEVFRQTKTPLSVEKPKPAGRVAQAPKGKAPKAPKVEGGFADAFDENPLIRAIIDDVGGIMSETAFRKSRGKEKGKTNADLYNDKPVFENIRHNKIYASKKVSYTTTDKEGKQIQKTKSVGSGGQTPDQAASQLAGKFGLPENATSSDLWAAIQQASDSAIRQGKAERGRAKDEAAAFGKAGQQEHAFKTDIASKEAGEDLIETGDLNVGDSVEVNGVKMEVTDVDEGGKVTLEDGKEYGTQYVEDDTAFYGKVISEEAPAAKPTGMETGLRNMAQRITNAEEAFIEFAQKQGELTRAEVETALARYKKEKAIKIDPVGGQYSFTHGGFFERDVLRRAAGVEEPITLHSPYEWGPDLRVTISPEGGKWKAVTTDKSGQVGEQLFDSREEALGEFQGARPDSFGRDFVEVPKGDLPPRVEANDWTSATEEVAQAGARLRLKANNEGGFTANLLPEAAEFGRMVFQQVKDFAAWSAEMVKRLGLGIRQHLKAIWESIPGNDTLAHRREGGALFGAGGSRGTFSMRGAAKTVGRGAKRTHELIAMQRRTELDASTSGRSAKLQTSFAEEERARTDIERTVRVPRDREAMSIYREAGGDVALLKDQLSKAKTKWFKRAAEDAINLAAKHPKAIGLLQKIGDTFDILERRGNRHGILEGHRDRYVPHIFDVSKPFTGIGASKLKDSFKFNKARMFDSFFDADQANWKKPTLDMAKILPAYMGEMNRVIADRQFAAESLGGKAPDGRPLLFPRGTARTIDTTDYAVELPGAKRATKVFDNAKDAKDYADNLNAGLKAGEAPYGVTRRPSTAAVVNPRGVVRMKDPQGNPINTRDYVSLDEPALNEMRWVETDPQGNATILKADMLAHPIMARRMNAMMGRSAIRKYYEEPGEGLELIPKAILKGLDTAQSVMKREMFGFLAPFHQVQEATHGIGHTINPFFGFQDMSRPTPAMIDSMRHGLMLLPEKGTGSRHLEGVGARSSFISQAARHFGGYLEGREGKAPQISGRVATAAADIIDGYQDYLFHQYIPALKFKTYEHIVERNMKRYAGELKSGEATASDVKQLSAEQANAAYGHLNYSLLNRNPTIQHLLQLGLLAPDFLEARGRFTLQAAKGFGTKAGHEQLRAVAVLSAVQASGAYIISSLLGDEWDPKHPFEVTHNNRTYTLRSVPEDLFRFLDPDQSRQFTRARLNPLLGKGIEAIEGRNYRGEKVTLKDTLEELFAQYIPITARPLPFLRDLTTTTHNSPVSPLENLQGSWGLKVTRYSTITKAYGLASAYNKAQGKPTDVGSYPVSKYQQLRYALEDADMERGREEYQKLLQGSTADKVRSGFKESLFKPFTGTKETDVLFKKKLVGDERKIVQEADDKRDDIWIKFEKIRKRKK